MKGTYKAPGLSALRIVALVVIWVLPVAITALIGAVLREETLAIGAFVVLSLLSLTATVAILRWPGRANQTWIADAEALRGEFRVQRPLLFVLSVPVGLLTYVGLRLLNETYPIAQLGRAWAIAAVVVMLLFGVPFTIMRNDVRNFRITDDEQVLISRGRAEEVLHVADFREVRSVVAQAGRVRPVARLVFAGHVAGGRRVVIPLSLIRSRAYGTPVPGQIVADFFQEQCERAGFVVHPARGGRHFGWSATREPSPATGPAASTLQGHDYVVTGRIITADGRGRPVELTVHGAEPLAEGEVRDAALGLLREEHPQCVWDGEATVKSIDATKH
jgi:multisubunit Na+/H+ antiporter MnhF subunit